MDTFKKVSVLQALQFDALRIRYLETKEHERALKKHQRYMLMRSAASQCIKEQFSSLHLEHILKQGDLWFVEAKSTKDVTYYFEFHATFFLLELEVVPIRGEWQVEIIIKRVSVQPSPFRLACLTCFKEGQRFTYVRISHS